LKSCSRLPTTSLASDVTPVTFAPGRFRLLINPAPTGSPTLANTIGMPIQVFEAHRSRREGWSSWYPHAGRCIVLVSTRRQMAERAITTRLPIVYGSREFAEAGGLISYGVDRRHMYRRAAEYVDMILKGAHPAELPVEQPTKFELVINLQAAKAIGLAVPDQLLALADDVIE
jgi:hypothetical protein